MDYRSAKLAHAREVTRDLCAAPEVDCAYLSGSLLADLGSPTSDIDVFVVLRPGVEPETAMRQIRGSGERVDVEFYTTGYIEAAIDAVTDWKLTRDGLSRVWVPENQLDFVVRLHYAEVLKDSPTLAGFRSTLGERLPRLRQFLLARWAVEANNYLEDFEGAYLDGDYDSAALVGQSLMMVAGKAVAAAAGELYFGRKWVFQQLRRGAGAGFGYAEFVDSQCGRWTRPDPVAGYARFRQDLQTLLTAAQCLGWQAEAVARWPHWRSGTGGISRDASFNPVRLSEGVLLNEEGRRQFVVKPDVALVWGLCNGQPASDVVRAAVALADAAPDLADLTEERAGTVLDGLLGRNLVRSA